MSAERQVLINLIASLSLCDHMGDAADDAQRALKQIGVDLPESVQWADDWWSALAKFLATEHGAETVWGTSLLEDDDGDA